MNNVINTFLLAGDKFMPEMHLRQPQFTYSACGPFTKHKQRIQMFKEKRKVQAAFKDNIWDADFADMQLLSKYNKGIRFLLCAIDIFSKYA